MAKRGPAPTPTALKVLRGNPGRRPLPKGEPKPAAGVPARPGWVTASADAAAFWDDVVKALPAGVITVADGAALALTAQLWARWRQVEAFSDAHGVALVLRDDRGTVKGASATPQAALGLKYAAQIKALLSEFGLTPAGRSRVQVDGETPEGAHAWRDRLFKA